MNERSEGNLNSDLIFQNLKKLVVPWQFKRVILHDYIVLAKRSGREFGYDFLNLRQEDKAEIYEIVAALSSPELELLVDRGNLTFGMIRPKANESSIRTVQLSDEEQDENVANLIISDAVSDSELEVAFAMPLVLSDELVEAIYEGRPKENMLKTDAEKYRDKFGNRWEEWLDLMTCGSSTVILFYAAHPHKDLGAVELWRRKLGNNRNVFENSEGTIRKKYALSDYNNLGHGSDSKEAVKRELNLVVEYLKKVL